VVKPQPEEGRQGVVGILGK